MGLHNADYIGLGLMMEKLTISYKSLSCLLCYAYLIGFPSCDMHKNIHMYVPTTKYAPMHRIIFMLRAHVNMPLEFELS